MLNGHGGVFLRINGVYPHLGRMEQRVANFIKNYPEEVVRLPINVLADKVGVSSSTVSGSAALVSKVTDLKLQLAQDCDSTRHACADEGDASGPEL